MARTSVTAFDSQTTENITLALPKIAVSTNYTVIKDDAGDTAISNITSDVDLPEQISFKYSSIEQVNSSLKATNKPTTKGGYQIIIRDEFIQRTTETDGTVHDDPVSCYITFRTTRGANITSGAAVAGYINRVLSAALMQTGTTTSTTYLDRLMRGATKPASLV
jgi:hypothetical protein